MLLKELSHVNELDSAISELHQKLSQLYQERSQLLQLQAPASNDIATLRTIWQQYGINLPSSAAVTRKYRKAVDVVAKLERSDTALRGRLAIVAVPPTAVLKEATADMHRYACVNSELFASIKPAKVWHFSVIAQHETAATITELAVLGDHEHQGLGVHEVIAADLQGVKTVQAGSWTILLKNSHDGSPLCVTTDNDQLILDVEDADCLLGNNIFQKAITV